MRRFSRITVLMLMCCLTFPLSGCGKIREIVNQYEAPTEPVKTTNENQYAVVHSDEEICRMILETMEANKTACYFNVADEAMVKTDEWIKKFDGINDIQVEVTMAQSGYNVFLTLSYWDMYPIVAAFNKSDTTILSATQLELCDKYIEIIGASVSKDKSDYDNVLALHDYLVANIQYDSTNQTAGAYDALIKGTAMCKGYTESFKTLLDMMGVENMVVSGYGNGEAHVWNLVNLDGEWYHIDVTWDDPLNGDGSVKHTYFNVDDADMALDHIWEKELYPKATGTKYCYYAMDGVNKVYNQTELNSLIASEVAAQKTRIEFVMYGEADLNAACQSTGVAMEVTYSAVKKTRFMVYDMTVVYK